MFGLRGLFRGLTVEERGDEIIVSGVDGNSIIRDINKHWKTTRITKNFFTSISRRRLSFYKFFAPEFTYLLDGISQYRNRFTSVKMINELKSKMYTDTWLRDVEREGLKGRLDFNRLKNMTFTPEDYQMAYFKDYDLRLNRYNLKGDLMDAATGTGKAQPLDSMIKVPGGWKRMGEVQVGDSVIAWDGSTTTVDGVYPQGLKDTFTITFADGRKVKACTEHLWQVNYNGLTEVLDTLKIKELLSEGITVTVPYCQSEQTNDNLVPIDPFQYGRDLNRLSESIPEAYLNGSTRQRRMLLQGFSLSQGYVTTSPELNLICRTVELARDITYIARSLGYFAVQNDKEVDIIVPKHKEGLEIVSIDSLETLECQCISIEHPDHLYITDDFIVTHNTFMGTALAEMLAGELIVIIVPKETLELVWIPSIDEMYRTKQTVWDSRVVREYNRQRFVICHYEALGKLLEQFKANPKYYQGKEIVTIVDECHNLNDIKSQRTQTYLELVRLLNSDNNILSSGTPVKAMGVELITMLRVVDPLFTPNVERAFRAMYGHTASKGLDIIKFRMGLVSYRIEKTVLELEKPLLHEHPIKIPNGKDYTLPAIKEVMREYIKERLEYYKRRKSEDESFWREVLNIHSNALQGSRERDLFKEYMRCLKLVIACTGNYGTVKDEIRFTNLYEKRNIEPTLPRTHIKRFRDVKSVIKYVDLKIQGECLGNVLGRKRIECHVDMAPYVDWVGIIESTTKKTIVFTSFVEALTASGAHLAKIGLKPLTVYGANKNEMVSTVSRFEKDLKANPLLATYASLSTGVRLVMADTIILLNSPFRQYILDQAVARAYRKGQDSRVIVYKVTLDTGDIPNISTRSDDILQWSAEQVAAMLGIQNTLEQAAVIATEDFKYDMELKDIPDEETLMMRSINGLTDPLNETFSKEHFMVPESTNQSHVPVYLR